MKLGKEILASNAGRTLFLTAKDQHFKQRFTVYEGDIICSLLQSLTASTASGR